MNNLVDLAHEIELINALSRVSQEAYHWTMEGLSQEEQETLEALCDKAIKTYREMEI